jgi:hypothetical protein
MRPAAGRAAGSGPRVSRPTGRTARRYGVVAVLVAVVVSTTVGLASLAPAHAAGGECLPLDDAVADEQPWPPGPDLPYGIAPDGRSFEVRFPPRSRVTVSFALQDRRTGMIRLRHCAGTNILDTPARVTWPLNRNQPDLIVCDVGPFLVRRL